MTPGFQQKLPSAETYRRELIADGAPFPLPYVAVPEDGLLPHLPTPALQQHGWPWTVQSRRSTLASRGVPSITIVVPSYNQGRYLEQTIRSVLLQNYPRLQLVVMDGGSNDESAAVIERYRPWLSFARSARDRGQAHAINLGFSLGSGEVFGWLNSDDLYLPDALHTVARLRQAGAEFVYGDLLEVDETTGRRSYLTAPYVKPRFARWGGVIFQPSAFWVAAKHQPLWEEQWCALDYELWIRLLPKMRIAYFNAALAAARKHPAAKTSDPQLKAKWDADAERNGLAHPQLYTNTLKNRLIAREYQLYQRFARSWRHRRAAGNLGRVLVQCEWNKRSD